MVESLGNVPVEDRADRLLGVDMGVLARNLGIWEEAFLREEEGELEEEPEGEEEEGEELEGVYGLVLVLLLLLLLLLFC